MRFGMLLGVLACGATGHPMVAITLPWDGMKLPIEQGELVQSSARSITLQYEGNDRAEVYQRYRRFFIDQQLEEVARNTNGDMETTVYRSATKQYTVSAFPLASLGKVGVTVTSDDL